MSPFLYIQTYCQTSGGASISNLSDCIQGVYNLLVILAIALAFIFVIVGAFQYMFSAAVNSRADGKDKIINALIGIFVIFVGGSVLYWINPQIFNANLLLYQVQNIQVPSVSPDFIRAYGNPVQSVGSPLPPTYTDTPQGIADLAAWYSTNYGIVAWNSESSNSTACNFFVAHVLQQVGAIPSGQCVLAQNFQSFLQRKGWQAIPYSSASVQPGDVLVRTTVISGNGHVGIAVGSGYFVAASLNSHGPRKTQLSYIQNSQYRFNWIMRMTGY